MFFSGVVVVRFSCVSEMTFAVAPLELTFTVVAFLLSALAPCSFRHCNGRPHYAFLRMSSPGPGREDHGPGAVQWKERRQRRGGEEEIQHLQDGDDADRGRFPRPGKRCGRRLQQGKGRGVEGREGCLEGGIGG